MTELNKEQEKHLRLLFDAFDADGSNTLDIKEFGNLVEQYGQSPSKKRLANALKLIDVNNDGRIDFEEVKIIFAATIKSPEENQRELEKATAKLMQNKGLKEDERLTKDIFLTIQKGLGNYPLTMEDSVMVFEHLGKNKATKEEIASLLRS